MARKQTTPTIKQVAVWSDRRARQLVRNHERRLKDARLAWRTLRKTKAGARRQLELLREVVETRHAELTAAYHNVTSVTYGFGRRAGAVRRDPCITFVVKEKVPLAQVGQDQRVPPEILAYCQVGRMRKLVAIPTDVEDESLLQRISPQAARTGRVQVTEGGIGGIGSIAAIVVVRPKGGKAEYLALSCMHVFNLVQEFHPDYAGKTTITLEHGAIGFAYSSRYVGSVRHQKVFSLDASLALIDLNQLSLLNQAILVRRPTVHVKNEAQIPPSYKIWVPHGEPIRAKLVRPWRGASRPIFYKDRYRRANVEVWHEVLLESLTDEPMVGGYSGSPVISDDESRFVGMHIAGYQYSSYMIPAWQLLMPESYYGLSKDDVMYLTNAY